MASTTCTAAGTCADLPLDLLVGVIARLVFPGDRAHFAAVCRAWRSAARELVMSHHDLPWVVLPTGVVCTAAGHGCGAASCSSFLVPGFPGGDTTTCLGAAHDCWLALDRTDDVFRRTRAGVPIVYARRDVKHRHTYMLHNAFSNATVPLPELDAVIGHVAETFQVHKVLMRSAVPDDVIAVTTNNWNYNIVLLRPGKGYFVLDEFRVVDVVFLGDTLYGITSGEELLAFRLGEYDDGRPNVTRIELLIKNLSAKYYHKGFPWTWPYDVVDNTDKRVSHDDDHNNHGGEVSEDVDNDGEDESDQEENDDNIKVSCVIHEALADVSTCTSTLAEGSTKEKSFAFVEPIKGVPLALAEVRLEDIHLASVAGGKRSRLVLLPHQDQISAPRLH